MVNDIDGASAQETVTMIVAQGGKATGLEADVSVESAVARLVADTVDVYGQIDILINNAGIDAIGSVEETTYTSWQRVHSVDLAGAFLCAKHATPHLVQSVVANIVNISSIHAFVTQPCRSAYASAKAGLIGLTKALAVELGPQGVRVNAIVPGYIRTEIWDKWLDKAGNSEETIRRISEQHPLRRVGHPEDIARAVAFLVSDDARFISGATLVVDGGLTATYVPPPI